MTFAIGTGGAALRACSPATASAVSASARMRATIDFSPFERCGVRCSRKSSRSNRADGSIARMSRAAGTQGEQDCDQPADDMGVAVALEREDRSAGAVRPRPGFLCSEASCCSSGCKSRRHRSPVDVVVISSSGEGDRPAGSLEVKVPPLAGHAGQIRTGGRATQQAAANANQ